MNTTPAEPQSELPVRPAVPLSLYCFIFALICIKLIAYFDGGVICGVSVCVAFVGLVCVLVGQRLYLSSRRRLHQLAFVLLSTLVTAVLSAHYFFKAVDASTDTLKTLPVSSLDIELLSDARKTKTGYRAHGRVRRDTKRIADVWLLSTEPLELGHTLTAVGRFQENGNTDFGKTSRAQGLAGTVRIVHIKQSRKKTGFGAWIFSLRTQALQLLEADSSDGRAILAGSVCGSRRAMDTRGLTELFARCGIAHLIAVSGGHLSIVSLIFGRALLACKLPLKLRLVILLICDSCFIIFCGSPISALRAFAMLASASVAQILGRRSYALTAVSCTALIFVLINPAVCASLSFILSAVCVMGLSSLSPFMGYVLDKLLSVLPVRAVIPQALYRVLHKLWEHIRNMVSATLVAQALTLPITLPSFGTISLIAPVANVLVTPLLSCSMVFAVVACLFSALPGLAALPLWVAELGANAAGCIVCSLSVVPGSSVHVQASVVLLWLACIVGIFVLLWFWPHISGTRLWLCILTFCALWGVMAVRARFFAPAEIQMLDVGQGDALLVRDGAAAILIDTGPDESVAQELIRLGVSHLDAVVLTHAHDDHTGGLSSLVGSVSCERLVVAQGVAESLSADLRRSCVQLSAHEPEEIAFQDELRVGRFRLQCLWPQKAVDGSHNEDSLQFAVYFEGPQAVYTGLFTGDAEHNETHEALKSSTLKDIDFLKVGHHGSEQSLDKTTAQRLSPRFALISAGEHNSYGHPTKACIDLLKQTGAQILCTKDVGAIRLTPTDEGFKARHQSALNFIGAFIQSGMERLALA